MKAGATFLMLTVLVSAARADQTVSLRASADLQRIKNPVETPPPSSRISDGVWILEPEYGAVIYTKEQMAALGLSADPGAEARLAALRQGAMAERVPSESISLETPAPGPYVLPPNATKGDVDLSFVPSEDTAQSKIRPTPELALAAKSGADAETMPSGAYTTAASERSSEFVAEGLNSQGSAHLSPKHTGIAEEFGRGRYETVRDAPADIPGAVTGARGVPNPTLGPKYRGIPGSFPSGSAGATSFAVGGTRGDWTRDDIEVTGGAIPDLIQFLEKGSPKLRARAADELSRRGNEAVAAVPALEKALAGDTYPPVRASAILALGNIGGDAAALRKLIEPFAKNKNADIRVSAQTALSRLQ